MASRAEEFGCYEREVGRALLGAGGGVSSKLALRALFEAHEPLATVALSASLLISAACSEPRFHGDDGGSKSAPCGIDCGDTGGEPVDASDRDAKVMMIPAEGGGAGRDAGLSADAMAIPDLDDGGALPDANAPAADAGGREVEAWKRQLEGRYVLRYRSYAREQTLGGLAVVASVQHSLATIAVDESGEATLTTQLCDDRGELTVAFAKTYIRASRPEKQPPRTFRLLYQDGAFQTIGDPSIIGYSEAAPLDCAPGRKLPARSDQPWLRTQCDCPTSELPPTSVTDCRLTDSDEDGHPGYTLQLSGFVQGQDYCRVRDASQLVNGQIAPNGRHSATLMRITDFFQLACEGNGCTRANGEACPGVMNVAEFAPLTPAGGAAPASCSEVMRQVGAGVYYSDNPLLIPSPGC